MKFHDSLIIPVGFTGLFGLMWWSSYCSLIPNKLMNDTLFLGGLFAACSVITIIWYFVTRNMKDSL